MATYGYVRISPTDPSGKIQPDGAEALKIPQENIFVDRQSVENASRPGLEQLLDTVERGDVIVVESLSRFARNAKELLDITESLKAKGVDFISQKEQIDTTTPVGKLILDACSAVIELDRGFVRERQAEGSAEAKARGTRFGRPMTKPPEDFVEIVELWERKKLHISEVLVKTGLKPATFYNRLREYRKMKGSG